MWRSLHRPGHRPYLHLHGEETCWTRLRAPPCTAAGNQCFPKASLMNEHLTTQPMALPFLNEISYSSWTVNSLGIEIDLKKQNSISEPPSRRMASWKGHGIWKATGLHMGLRASWLCGLGHITVLGPRPFTSEEEIMNSTSLTWGEVKVKLRFKMAVKWSPHSALYVKGNSSSPMSLSEGMKWIFFYHQEYKFPNSWKALLCLHLNGKSLERMGLVLLIFYLPQQNFKYGVVAQKLLDKNQRTDWNFIQMEVL